MVQYSRCVLFEVEKDERFNLYHIARKTAEFRTSGADDFLNKEWPISSGRSNSKYVFSPNEMGIYFCALSGLKCVRERKRKRKTAKGFKTAKDRITALVVCTSKEHGFLS